MGRHKSSSKKSSSPSKKSKSKSSSGDSSSRKSGGGALGRLTAGTTVKRMGHPASGSSSDAGNSKAAMTLKIGNSESKYTKGEGWSSSSSDGSGDSNAAIKLKIGNSEKSYTSGQGWSSSSDGGDKDVIGSIRLGKSTTKIKNPFRRGDGASSSSPGDAAKPSSQGDANEPGRTWVSAQPSVANKPSGQTWVSAQPSGRQDGSGPHASHGPQPSRDAGDPRQRSLEHSKRALAQARGRASELELLAEANAMAAATDPTPENLDLASASRLEAQRARARAAAIENSMRGELPGFKFPTYAVPFDRGGSSMSDDEARDVFSKEKSWPAIKAAYADQPEKMAGLFAFRKKYVDSLINELRTQYPNLIANAAGSTDLTSDYDVTVSVVGDPKASVEVIATLNETMRSDFGAESGTVFDTNFYYKAVAMKDNILKDGHFAGGSEASSQIDANKVGALSEPEPSRPVTSGSKEAYDRDQDVLALMKINRYADDKSWTTFKEQTLSSIASRPDGEAARREASARFNEAEGKVAGFEQETDARLRGMGFDPTVDPHTLPGAERAKLDDAILKANNLAYLDRLALVADKEAQESALVDAVASATTREARDQAWQALNDVRRDIYALRGDSLFFAAEAYHSTGALVHIVEGIQGGGAINAPLELLLQSFNEQFGDLMKDAGHYADDGEFFYRSAKYAGRMGVAMRDYFLKANGLTPGMLEDAGITVDEAMTGRPAALAALR